MNKIKSYDELTFVDDFMFCKIMTTNLDICKEILELILNIPIQKIKLPEAQKAISVTADGKGIRLDVYAADENGTVYDIEMQTTYKTDLAKRSRYYQGMIDLDLIEKGSLYSELKKSYIIFICIEKPFKDFLDLPIYTFKSVCTENRDIVLSDEITRVFLNVSTGQKDIPQNLRFFFDYLKGKAPQNDLCKKIDVSVSKAISHEDWRSDYMTLSMKYKEIYSEGQAEGRAEGIIKGRSEGETRLGRLILLLEKNGRLSEISKVASDEAYRARLYEEFRIDEEK